MQIQSAIEQGRLILGQSAMKVDTNPFPSVNMVEHGHSARRQLDFSLGINMAGAARRCSETDERAGSSNRARADDRQYVPEERVRHVRYQRPLSAHLLNKYESQYSRRRHQEPDDEGYESRAEKSPDRRGGTQDHWRCPFFQYCWNSGMSRLPTVDNCPGCGPLKKDAAGVSVFQRLGPIPLQNRLGEPSSEQGLEDEGAGSLSECSRPEGSGSDCSGPIVSQPAASSRLLPGQQRPADTHSAPTQPRWCPDGLNHS